MNDLLNELASYLEDQGVGVFDADSGRNIFVDFIPPDPASLVALLYATGPTIGAQREVADLQFPRFQVFVRNVSHDDGSDKLQAVREALHGKYGLVLAHWRVIRCHADQEGGWIGKEGGLHEFSINFVAEVNAETSS